MSDQQVTPENGTDADIVATEQDRIVAVTRACEGRHPAILAAAIREGWNVDRTTLEVMRADRPKAPGVSSYGRQHGDPGTVIQAAMLMRLGRESLAEKHYGATVCEQARGINAKHILDIAEYGLRAVGHHVPSTTDEMILASSSLSYISLPTALGSSADKILQDQYEHSPQTWRQFCAVRNAANFKDQSAIRASHIGDLLEVSPAGEIKHGSITEAVQTYKIDTFGRNISISRQDLINDDLGVFLQTIEALGMAAQRAVADLIYQTLLSAGSFFASGNGNLLSGAPSALSTTSVGNAISAMRKQRDANNSDLDIRPHVLVVPPELEITGRTILESTHVVVQPTSAGLREGISNPFPKLVSNLEVEPRLSNSAKFTSSSATAWYLFSSPQNAPLNVGFLKGKETPTVETLGLDADANRLAMTFRCYFDFGCGLGDFRAAVKSNGV